MEHGRIRLVCFDVGGVLVRHCRNWAEGCRAAGLPLHAVAESPDMLTRRRELSHLHTTGKIGGAEFCRRVSTLLGGVYSAEQVGRVHRAWLGREYAGVFDLVERLVKSGRVETAALSNTNDDHWARFDPGTDRMPVQGDRHATRGSPDTRNGREFPSVGLLRHRFASHVLGFAKPDPRIYEAFERAMRAAGFDGSPSSILFLDDLPDNVGAARARGWVAEGIDHTRETASQIEGVLRRYDVL
jgi:FMN phosphatase YigB (HAD superfamily)